MPRLSLLCLALTLFIMIPGCGKRLRMPPVKPAGTAAIEVVEQAPPPEPKHSEPAQLREKLKDYVTLLSDCDRTFFADVKPERIDKWELPVNVAGMERACDDLVRRQMDLVECGGFKAPLLDQFLRQAAAVSDQYQLLAFRSKKVGVRDKEPYKRMVTDITVELRTDVGQLKEGIAPVLALSDADLTGAVTDEELVQRAHAVFSALREDVRQGVEVPLKEGRPVLRQVLKTSDVIAATAVRSLRLLQTYHIPQSYLDAIILLTRSFSDLNEFYAGDYFETEEVEGPKRRSAVTRADQTYRNAWRRAFPE